MATLNLGRIKPVFRGAYNNSTAYVVDDIVTSGGSSYICIAASTGNAVSNATYWTQMAAGGTDVGATLTTQGDILYRDGSGLQRLGAGTSGQLLKTQGTGANPVWATVDSGKIKQTHWQWDNQQASIPQTTSSGTGLDIFNYAFTAQSDNPHFVLDLSVYIGRNNSGNDQGDLYVVAWIHDTSGGTIRYPFGFYKSGGYRCNSSFRGLTGNYFLEETDAGQYSNTDSWGAMRYTYAGVMGNQSSADTTASASSGISAGQGLTLSIHLGGSGDTWYNRTSSQTNSMSRSWFRLTELDGTL
jgi:hypothetical protein